MVRDTRPTAGAALVTVGAPHTAFGLAAHRRTLGEIARDGVFDAVEGDREREPALWFLMCGVSLTLTGWLARWAQPRTGDLPDATGPVLLAVGASGAILMPRSGFWAVFVPAILAPGGERK